MSFWAQYELKFVPPPSLPVLAIANLKGGVGKTAVVSYLTLALAARGFRVLAIDLDFQGSLTTALHYIRLRPEHTGIIDFLLSESVDVLYDYKVISPSLPPWSNITVVGADFELADKEDALFAQLVTGFEPLGDPRTLLAHKLSHATIKRDFDIAILDTPPRLTIGSINALIACTHIIIPTTPTMVSMNGAKTFEALLGRLRAYICPRAQVLAALPTMTEPRWSKDVGRGFKSVEFWSDLPIPRRQAIARNDPLNSNDIQTLFQPLSERVIKRMGLIRGEAHAGSGTRESARSDRPSVQL